MQRRAGFGARLVLLAGAWIAGVALQLQQRGLWSTETYELILAGGLCCGAIGWAGWRGRGALAAACLGVLLTAHGATGLRAALRLADALPAAIEGRDLVVSGVVAGLPQRSATGLRFRFETDAATLDGQPVTVPALLTVGWFKGQHEDAVLSEPQAELRAGQRWRFTLRLRRPHGSMNPHGFDYELLLFEQGVRATASVRDAPPPQLLHRAAGYPVERLRQRVRDAIEASVPDRRAAGVLAALAVGDQGAIERGLRKSLLR
jgi:competence protein ComEC